MPTTIKHKAITEHLPITRIVAMTLSYAKMSVEQSWTARHTWTYGGNNP